MIGASVIQWLKTPPGPQSAAYNRDLFFSTLIMLRDDYKTMANMLEAALQYPDQNDAVHEKQRKVKEWLLNYENYPTAFGVRSRDDFFGQLMNAAFRNNNAKLFTWLMEHINPTLALGYNVFQYELPQLVFRYEPNMEIVGSLFAHPEFKLNRF